ncbi:MAG: lysine exporter LysO family protein [Prevotellaceae bacterium]|nr:lysine exporter LysO family protein [Prevotellaceae bacterium]
MKNSIIAILFFVAGIICAKLQVVPECVLNSDFTFHILCIQMLFVGICMGAEVNRSILLIKSLHVRILLVPFTAITGTLLGALLFSLFVSKMPVSDLLAIGSGFGYYSLSSIYISEIRGETLGIIALLANIAREITGLVFTPLLAKYFGKLAPIAAAGATSMDTCLPIITSSTGKNYAIISVFSGTVLTILVPFLITFILNVM